MQFLKTLFWVVLAIVLVLFASVNWHAVTVRLWGGLEADVKLPILVLASFLIGFLPMLVFHQARMWSIGRRMEAHERQAAALHNGGPAPSPPTPAATVTEDRIATDAKAWPTS